MRLKTEAHITVQKLIPNVNPQYRQEWKLPEDHESAGLVSCDNEDVLILALDDATKKDRVRVAHVQKAYVGGSKLLGEFPDACTAIISGPKVQDVRRGGLRGRGRRQQVAEDREAEPADPERPWKSLLYIKNQRATKGL